MSLYDDIQVAREILSQYRNGEEITNASHIAWLTDFFSGHPGWEDKRGAGVRGFRRIARYEHKPTSCFAVVREDGSEVDISMYAVRAKKKRPEKIAS